jgi:hypothetical protein
MRFAEDFADVTFYHLRQHWPCPFASRTSLTLQIPPLLQLVDESMATSNGPSFQPAGLDLLRAMAQIATRKLAESSLALRQLNSGIMARMGGHKRGGKRANKERVEMHLE